ncbi:MAG: DegT/DnrJ/EryC1/StrS family aminotransferase [SAR202 cluster bacterium]|nr:DegT/DnrJ/EryC1/StrS family aminotransferase [SAR202 cluster bacterium]
MTERGLVRIADLLTHRASIGDQIDSALMKVISHGHFIMGPEVKQLEADLVQYCGASSAVTCGNGTDALVLALRALGVGVGDGVIVPAFTFAASAEAPALVGATPVFVDVDPETWCIDPSGIKAGLDAARSAGLIPRAVIAVDLFGQPADYRRLQVVTSESGLFLVADAAQSFGGTREGLRVGSLAPVTATSFFPTKPLGCYGDGGAVFTQDPELANVVASLRTHGMGDHKYDHVRVGTNSRLDTIQAAVLIEKLTVLDEELKLRQEAAGRYLEMMDGELETQSVLSGSTSTWAQFAVRVDGSSRERIRERLSTVGVETAVHYPLPLNRQPAFREFPTATNLGVSELLATEVLALPLHPWIEPAEQERVVEALLGVK